MPSSSSRFTSEASVKRAGGEVSWPFDSTFVATTFASTWSGACTRSPTASFGSRVSFSSSSAAGSSLPST